MSGFFVREHHRFNPFDFFGVFLILAVHGLQLFRRHVTFNCIQTNTFVKKSATRRKAIAFALVPKIHEVNQFGIFSLDLGFFFKLAQGNLAVISRPVQNACRNFKGSLLAYRKARLPYQQQVLLAFAAQHHQNAHGIPAHKHNAMHRAPIRKRRGRIELNEQRLAPLAQKIH